MDSERLADQTERLLTVEAGLSARELAERIATLVDAALATARRQGAEEMRERAAKVADAEVAMNEAAQRRAEHFGREHVASHRESDATTAARIAAAIRALSVEDQSKP